MIGSKVKFKVKEKEQSGIILAKNRVKSLQTDCVVVGLPRLDAPESMPHWYEKETLRFMALDKYLIETENGVLVQVLPDDIICVVREI